MIPGRRYWCVSMMDDIIASLKRIQRHPRYPLIHVIMLSVSLGSMMAILDIARHTLFAPLPYPNANTIVVGGERVSDFLISPDNWQPNPRASSIFTSIAQYHYESAILYHDSRGKKLLLAYVTPKFFSVLGVVLKIGSDFPPMPAPRPDRAISWLPIIISHRLWRKEYDLNRNIIGRNMHLKRLYPYRFLIIGVAPTGVRLPRGVDAWIPMHLDSTSEIQNANTPNWTDFDIARLKPGISVTEAERAIRSWPKRQVLWIWEHTSHLVPLRDFLGGDIYRFIPMLWLLTFLFLSLTVGSMVIICRQDFKGRQEELRIRKILGAGAGRLFRLLSIEITASLALGIMVSLFIRVFFLRLTMSFLQIRPLFSMRLSTIDITVMLSATALLSLFILIPEACVLGVLRHTRSADIQKIARPSKFRLPFIITTSTIIIVMTIILLKTSSTISQVNLGIQPNNVYVCGVMLPLGMWQYSLRGIKPNMPEKERDRMINDRMHKYRNLMNIYFSLMLQRIKENPVVDNAGVISIAPYNGYATTTVEVYISQRKLVDGSFTNGIASQLISLNQGAMKTLGMHILYGHGFNRGMDKGEIIINQTFAKRIGVGAEALGKYMRYPGMQLGKVIGIVNDVRSKDLFANPVSTIYLPFNRLGLSDTDIVIRTRKDMPIQEVLKIARTSVHAVIPGTIITRFESMATMVMSAERLIRYTAGLLIALAILSMFIVGISIWVEMTGEVRQRRHEIGIRMAIGANYSEIILFMLRKQLLVNLCAVVIGSAVAWWLESLIGYLFHGYIPTVTWIVFGVCIIEAYTVFIAIQALMRCIRNNPYKLITCT